MTDNYLFCNYKNCKIPITKFVWVTRCSHVFCEDHGNMHFLNNASKIKCPACNETNTRETDIIKSNLNPHDMLLSCVRPEKVLDYVINCTKLWSYQMQQKRKFTISMLSDKYERIASDAVSKLKNDNNEMKKFLLEIEERLKAINEELMNTKKKLWKYKMAYEELRARGAQNTNPHELNQSFFSGFNSEELKDNNVEDMIRSRYVNLVSP